MINITKLQIDVLADKIEVDISTSTGNTIEKVYIWESKDFKDYSKVVDLSDLLKKDSENEVFSIFAKEHLNREKITGLWFLEFTSSETVEPDSCSVNSNMAIGLVSNIIPYYECILNKLMKINITDCKPVINNCDNCTENLYYVNALLNTLQLAIKEGHYEEAIKIVNTLDEVCEVCHSCPSYSDTLLINGLGFGVINNSITDQRNDEIETFIPTIKLVVPQTVGATTVPANQNSLESLFVVVDDNLPSYTEQADATIVFNNEVPVNAKFTIGFRGGLITHYDTTSNKVYSYQDFANDVLSVPVNF